MGQNLYDLIWFNLQVGVEQTGEEENFLSLGRKTTNIMWYAEQRDNQPMSNSTDITWYGNPNTEYKYGNQNMEYKNGNPNMEYEIWKSKCGIWNMVIQIWNIKYGNPYTEYELWKSKYMEYEIWKSKYGLWNMEIRTFLRIFQTARSDQRPLRKM